MKLTQREKIILIEIVKSYINLAKPVSSRLIYEKKRINASPATIRKEMEILTKNGYLHQPYTSAGRVPTDKGYRFFVDNLLKNLSDKENKFQKAYSRYFSLVDFDLDNVLKIGQLITKRLALFSSNLSLFYLQGEDFTYEEGWDKIVQEPEFRERKVVFEITEILNRIEEDVNSFIPKESDRINIYIGKEISIPRCKDVSLIVSRYFIPKVKESGLIGLIGPKRMSYDKNISLINLASEFLEEIK